MPVSKNIHPKFFTRASLPFKKGTPKRLNVGVTIPITGSLMAIGASSQFPITNDHMYSKCLRAVFVVRVLLAIDHLQVTASTSSYDEFSTITKFRFCVLSFWECAPSDRRGDRSRLCQGDRRFQGVTIAG